MNNLISTLQELLSTSSVNRKVMLNATVTYRGIRRTIISVPQQLNDLGTRHGANDNHRMLLWFKAVVLQHLSMHLVLNQVDTQESCMALFALPPPTTNLHPQVADCECVTGEHPFILVMSFQKTKKHSWFESKFLLRQATGIYRKSYVFFKCM